MFGVAKRFWIPMVIVIVVAVAAVTVSRLHSVFGSHQHAPDTGNHVVARGDGASLGCRITVNDFYRPGMSGDSSSWKGWGHVRWFI
ncbi:MmpS family transport accessory protein, partial [Mycobacterium tuberculosis]|uniref:MmpS family transport accessory protein n=1 Tax=Mycobacterium tuberculosis TaxID=1773 RepID=UPI000A55515B